MKQTFSLRRIDSNGRIVIPKDMIANILKAKENETVYVEITGNDDSIIIKRYHSPCAFCDETANLISFNGGKICPNCLKKLKEL